MDRIYDEYFDKIYNWSLKKTSSKEDVFNLAKGILDRANEAVQESKKEKTK